MKMIAVRMYDLDGETAVDTLHQRGRSWCVRMTGGGEPERWEMVSEARAAEWLSEAPEQLL